MPICESVSLADLTTQERTARLIALTRFGRIHPLWGITSKNGEWRCECGGTGCKAGKHPRLKRFHQRASSDPETLIKWAHEFPNANWGILCGDTEAAEPIEVLDIDRKDVDGELTLDTWVCGLASASPLPDTVTVNTGTGRHLWFRAMGRLSTSTNTGIGLDGRAKGSYVLAPGSRHTNGSVYRFSPGLGPSEVECAECPAWVAEALTSDSHLICQSQYSEGDSTGCDNCQFTGVWGAGFPGQVGPDTPEPAKVIGLSVSQTVTTPDGEELMEFTVAPQAELTPWEVGRLAFLRARSAKLDATWRKQRGPGSQFPFRSGRKSNSEYEGALAFLLRGDRWSADAIMRAIATWNREHQITTPLQPSRYAHTIRKAMQQVNWRIRTRAPKGAWRQGDGRERVIVCLLTYGPQTPAEVAKHLALKPATARKLMSRMARQYGELEVVNGLYAVPVSAVVDEVLGRELQVTHAGQ